MIKWLKKYWWILFVIDVVIFAFLPIIINSLYLLETDYTILHKPSPWTSFWATYLAAAASFGMVLLTAISIIYNLLDNKKNRELQSNVIKYQTKLQWINQLKEAIICARNAFDESVVNDFLKKFNPNSNNQDFGDICQCIDNKITQATFAIETVLLGCKEKIEMDFLDVFKEKRTQYQHYISDVVFVLQFHNNFKNKSGINNTEYFQQLLEEYKNSNLRYSDSNPERIWEIAEKYNFQLISKRHEILKELLSYNDSIGFAEDSKYLIEMEIKNAEQILNNGTEQTK